MSKRSGGGFTLVELLIVIVIIAVLATAIIIIINPLTQLQKARDAERKSNLSQLQKAFEAYYQDNGRYPDSSGNIIAGVQWGQPWTPYTNSLPKDPTSSKKYIYVASMTGQAYYLYASLDRGAGDPQACFTSGSPCSSAVTNGVSTACGGNCNYGVSSPNVSP